TGHSAMEEMLAAMVGAGKIGRILVAAAGNDGASDVHASGTMLHRSETSIPIDVGFYGLPPNPGDGASAGFEVWYPKEGALVVSVVAPSGTEYGPVAFSYMRSWQTNEGAIFLANANGGTDPASGRNGIYGSFQQSTSALVAPGRWKVVLRGHTPAFD